MKLLLISWYFPPYNDIGAVRTGRWADYLHASGREVWVITGERDHADQSLACSLPACRVIRTAWFDVDRLSPTGSTNKINQRADAASPRPLAPSPTRKGLRSRLSEHYAAMIRIPDRQVGWLPYLVRAGRELMEKERFDLLYVSGPSFTAFLGASRLSRQFHVPWIAEYRDPWSRDAYRRLPDWRGPIDTLMENHTLKTASGVVAVSEPWARRYRERFGKPTIAIYNGFETLSPPTKANPEDKDKPVSIVYPGILYEGLRDPSLLYEAIRQSSLTPRDLSVMYYGPKAAEVLPLAKKLGVQDFVKVEPRVGYADSLEIQRNADILLLLQSPADPGNVPAKFFEYLAARRPILGTGLEEGVPAQLINERRAGLYVSDANVIASQLKDWVNEKRQTGSIKPIGAEARRGLSRDEQFGQLKDFLASVLVHKGREGS